MKPIDPRKPASADPRARMAPPYVDEDPEAALAQQGLDEAESETRAEAADDYGITARLGNDTDDNLEDSDYPEDDSDLLPPEVAAMHREFIPLPDEDDEE